MHTKKLIKRGILVFFATTFLFINCSVRKKALFSNCKICCDSFTEKNLIVEDLYEGFTIHPSIPDIKLVTNFSYKPQYVWAPTTKEITELEQNISTFVPTGKIQCIENQNYLYLRKFVRQYAGFKDINDSIYYIVTFHFTELLENFCANYHHVFKTNLVNLKFQKYGYSFVLIYNKKEHSFIALK